jgi:PUA domain
VADAASATTALGGGPAGTYFAAARGRRPATRLLWLKHAAVAHGSLRLDHGAVEAVVKRRASLLPAGITGVEGTFDAGDPVNLRDENGTIVARGLVNYDATEIPGLMGRSTRWLASKLGPEYEREVVHRDDLVIVLAVQARGFDPPDLRASCRRCCRRRCRGRGSAGGRTGRRPPGPRSRPRRGRCRSAGPGTGSTSPGRPWPRS